MATTSSVQQSGALGAAAPAPSGAGVRVRPATTWLRWAFAFYAAPSFIPLGMAAATWYVP